MKKIILFGISFTDTNFSFLKKKIGKIKLLFVFPAAPALINIYKDKTYYKSIKNADFVLFDSGYLCLLLQVLKGIKVKKFSGLKFLRLFLKEIKKRKKKIFLINPTKEDTNINQKYLKSIGIDSYEGYTAPNYGPNTRDLKLLKIIKKIKPSFILINLGGGTQEKLGLYIKDNIKFNCSIICSGAAIAFLTGLQANIPKIVDKIYLGWLSRIIFNPSQYFFRYLKSFKLFFILLRLKIKVIN